MRDGPSSRRTSTVSTAFGAFGHGLQRVDRRRVGHAALERVAAGPEVVALAAHRGLELEEASRVDNALGREDLTDLAAVGALRDHDRDAALAIAVERLEGRVERVERGDDHEQRDHGEDAAAPVRAAGAIALRRGRAAARCIGSGPPARLGGGAGRRAAQRHDRALVGLLGAFLGVAPRRAGVRVDLVLIARRHAAGRDEPRLIVARLPERRLVLLGLERRVLDGRLVEKLVARRRFRGGLVVRRVVVRRRRGGRVIARRRLGRLVARRLLHRRLFGHRRDLFRRRGLLGLGLRLRLRLDAADRLRRHVGRRDGVLEGLRRQRAPGAPSSTLRRGASAVLGCAGFVRALAEHVQTG